MHAAESAPEFTMEGQFIGFVADGPKLKYLKLLSAQQEYWFKLPKDQRASEDWNLKPQEWIRVSGERKQDRKTGTFKLKVHEVHRTTTAVSSVARPQAKILVCGKSDCWKRGGREVCHALQETLQKQGLEQQVTIVKTGCMDRCKAGPNVVIMPNKTRHTRVQLSEVPALVKECSVPKALV
jgi:NADH:ubiquinone oxidoreductase subunit E